VPLGKPDGTVICVLQAPLASVAHDPTPEPFKEKLTVSPAAAAVTEAVTLDPCEPELGVALTDMDERMVMGAVTESGSWRVPPPAANSV
jgi:hypothetical protein